MNAITLCSWSALRYYRLPPAIIELLTEGYLEHDPIDYLNGRPDPIFDLLGHPLHVLVNRAGARNKSNLFRNHVISGELPAGSYLQISASVFITSPAATLLTLAPELSPEQLAVVASELAGAFTLFNPPTSQQAVLDASTPIVLPDDYANYQMGKCTVWEQSVSSSKRATNLWSRPRLLSKGELQAFVDSAFCLKGIKPLRYASKLMVENARSPFEVQAAILFGQSRRRGGEGLPFIGCNLPIELPRTEQEMASRNVCYGDLLFESSQGTLLDIECQSKAWHSAPEDQLSDSDRATAIQCAGCEVILLTFKQMQSDKACDRIAQLAYSRLGLAWKERSLQQEEKRQRLRAEILKPLDV